MDEKIRILAVSSLSLFILYFVYDIPTAINTSMRFNGKPADAHNLAIIYMTYAFPNVFCPLLFGKLYGLMKNKTILVLGGLILAGQLVFIAGLFRESIKMAAVGRAFYGMGLESFFVLCENRITGLFLGNELAVATGLFIAIGRLGTVCVFYVAPLIVLQHGIVLLYRLAIGLILVAVCLLVYLASSNGKGDEKEEMNETGDNKQILGLMYRSIFLFGAIWAPFYNIAPIMFQTRFNVDKIKASRYLCCVEGSSIILQTFVGFFVDYYGYKVYMIIGSALLILAAHSNFLFKLSTVSASIVALAIAAPMMACYWPCLPKVVSKKNMAATLSTVSCIANFAYMTSPLVVSFLLRYNNDYTAAEIYMCVLSIVLLYTLVKLSYLNESTDCRLNEPEIKGKQIEIAQ